MSVIDADTIGAFHRNPQDTELAAALGVKTGTSRRKVYDALASVPGGLTDYQLSKHTGLRLYTAAPRRTELVRLGLVEDSGKRRPTDSGSLAIVWKVAA